MRGRNKKDDPNQIGNRDVGKGVNFYSLEKEMALGKQLAEEVQRQAKMVDDPLISEYVNRIGQNLVRNSDAKVPFTFQVIEGNSTERVRAAGRVRVRVHGADQDGGRRGRTGRRRWRTRLRTWRRGT